MYAEARHSVHASTETLFRAGEIVDLGSFSVQLAEDVEPELIDRLQHLHNFVPYSEFWLRTNAKYLVADGFWNRSDLTAFSTRNAFETLKILRPTVPKAIENSQIVDDARPESSAILATMARIYANSRASKGQQGIIEMIDYRHTIAVRELEKRKGFAANFEADAVNGLNPDRNDSVDPLWQGLTYALEMQERYLEDTDFDMRIGVGPARGALIIPFKEHMFIVGAQDIVNIESGTTPGQRKPTKRLGGVGVDFYTAGMLSLENFYDREFPLWEIAETDGGTEAQLNSTLIESAISEENAGHHPYKKIIVYREGKYPVIELDPDKFIRAPFPEPSAPFEVTRSQINTYIRRFNYYDQVPPNLPVNVATTIFYVDFENVKGKTHEQTYRNVQRIERLLVRARKKYGVVTKINAGIDGSGPKITMIGLSIGIPTGEGVSTDPATAMVQSLLKMKRKLPKKRNIKAGVTTDPVVRAIVGSDDSTRQIDVMGPGVNEAARRTQLSGYDINVGLSTAQHIDTWGNTIEGTRDNIPFAKGFEDGLQGIAVEGMSKKENTILEGAESFEDVTQAIQDWMQTQNLRRRDMQKIMSALSLYSGHAYAIDSEIWLGVANDLMAPLQQSLEARKTTSQIEQILADVASGSHVIQHELNKIIQDDTYRDAMFIMGALNGGNILPFRAKILEAVAKDLGVDPTPLVKYLRDKGLLKEPTEGVYSVLAPLLQRAYDSMEPIRKQDIHTLILTHLLHDDADNLELAIVFHAFAAGDLATTKRYLVGEGGVIEKQRRGGNWEYVLFLNDMLQSCLTDTEEDIPHLAVSRLIHGLAYLHMGDYKTARGYFDMCRETHAIDIHVALQARINYTLCSVKIGELDRDTALAELLALQKEVEPHIGTESICTLDIPNHYYALIRAAEIAKGIKNWKQNTEVNAIKDRLGDLYRDETVKQTEFLSWLYIANAYALLAGEPEVLTQAILEVDPSIFSGVSSSEDKQNLLMIRGNEDIVGDLILNYISSHSETLAYEEKMALFVKAQERFARARNYKKLGTGLNNELDVISLVIDEAAGSEQIMEAEEKIREALFIAEGIKDKEMEAYVHSNAGVIFLRLNRLEEMGLHFERSTRLFVELGTAFEDGNGMTIRDLKKTGRLTNTIISLLPEELQNQLASAPEA